MANRWEGLCTGSGLFLVPEDRESAHAPVSTVRIALLIALVGSAHLLLQGTARGEKYALLVGVRRYDPNELRSLPYSEADVVALAKVLGENGIGPRTSC